RPLDLLAGAGGHSPDAGCLPVPRRRPLPGRAGPLIAGSVRDFAPRGDGSRFHVHPVLVPPTDAPFPHGDQRFPITQRLHSFDIMMKGRAAAGTPGSCVGSPPSESADEAGAASDGASGSSDVGSLIG